MKQLRIIVSFLVLVLLCGIKAQAQYVFTTIKVPMSTSTEVNGIDGGNLVGTYTDASGNQHGFLYNGSTFTTLDDPLATNGTMARAISGNEIVGTYLIGANIHGFLYQGGTYTTIDDPLAGGSSFSSIITGISGSNIVGYYHDNSGVSHGFIYNGRSYNNIDYPGASATYAMGISGNKIVGYYYISTYQYYGFLYDGSNYTPVDYPEYPTGISGDTVVGTFINVSPGYVYSGGSYITVNDYAGGGTQVNGISGTTLVGSYYGGYETYFGFRADYPSPNDTPLMPPWSLLILGALLMEVARRFLPQKAPTSQYKNSETGV